MAHSSNTWCRRLVNTSVRVWWIWWYKPFTSIIYIFCLQYFRNTKISSKYFGILYHIHIYIVLSLHLDWARHHHHNTQIARVKLLVLIDLLVCITYIHVSSSLHPMVKLKSFSRAKLNALIILIRFIHWYAHIYLKVSMLLTWLIKYIICIIYSYIRKLYKVGFI